MPARRTSPIMSLCLVAGPEDLVIVDSEECTTCTNRKLDVLQRFPLSSDAPTRHKQIQAFLQQCHFPTSTAKDWNDRHRASVIEQNRVIAAEAARQHKTPHLLVVPEPYREPPKLRTVRVRCDCT